MIPDDLIPAIVAMALVILGALGWRLRMRADGGKDDSSSESQSSPPVADTTTETLDDDTLTPPHPSPDPAGFPDDSPDAVATVSDWTDDTEL